MNNIREFWAVQEAELSLQVEGSKRLTTNMFMLVCKAYSLLLPLSPQSLHRECESHVTRLGRWLRGMERMSCVWPLGPAIPQPRQRPSLSPPTLLPSIAAMAPNKNSKINQTMLPPLSPFCSGLFLWSSCLLLMQFPQRLLIYAYSCKEGQSPALGEVVSRLSQLLLLVPKHIPGINISLAAFIWGLR